MKNKKGFMLAEIVIVSVVVMIALVSLFTLTSKMFIQYDKRVVYDTVDATYVARGLAENYTKELIAGLFKDDSQSYHRYDKNYEYLKKNNVVHSYIVRYNYDDINAFVNKEYLDGDNSISDDEQIGINFYDYIINFNNNNDFSDSSDDMYIIFTEISDNCDSNKTCTEDNGNINFGHYIFRYKINVIVDEEIGINDEEFPPIIGDVNFTVSSFEEYTISWNLSDKNIKEVDKFIVQIFDNRKGSMEEVEVNGNSFSITQSNKNIGYSKFYAKVYAISKDGKSGKDYCIIAPHDYCKKTSSKDKGKLTITESLNNSTLNWITNKNNIYKNDKISFTVAPNDNKSSLGKDYTYTFDKWQIKYGDVVKKEGTTPETVSYTVTENFSVVVKSTETVTSCVAEGSKILLANGEYKNVEDIDYNDLLVVMDYKNGGITYQYPLWLEKEGISENYIKITFSDDSYINIVGDHAFFSYDDNEFVTVSNYEKFNIGTKVAKLNNGKIEVVEVNNIELISEKTKYYLIMSTRYYNFIANDLITSDDAVEFVNLYGFNSDITWKEPIATDLYAREELNMLPNYLYEGLRAGEAKYMNKFGLDYETFVGFLYLTQLNEEIWEKPKLNENGKREWMVTTSDDIVTEKNKLSYLMEEGDYYILKQPINKSIENKKFIGWLHTGKNIMYKPGDKVKVLYGTHFIAKYKDLFDNYSLNGSDNFEKIK